MFRLLAFAALLLLSLPAQAAVSCALIVAGNDDTDSTTYSTASITPSANSLILIAVGSADLTSVAAPSSVAGNGITYAQVNSIGHNLAAAPTNRITVLRGLAAAPTTGAITITFGSTQTEAWWVVAECNGVAQGGTNGSEAVVQSVTNSGDSATSFTVTLAAFGHAANATYGAFSPGSPGDTVSPGSGFTTLGTATGAGGRVYAEWKATNDTSVDASKDGLGSNWGGVAIEIKARLTMPGRSRMMGVGT